MSRYPNLIDNNRRSLDEVLREVAKNHTHLSIATGYWDIEGTEKIIKSIEKFEKVRLLIGQEPFSHRLQTKNDLDFRNPENLFPEAEITYDLEKSSSSDILTKLRSTAEVLGKMIEENRLEVKIFRTPRFHAKAYIFGNEESIEGVGIIGSSNFTKAGLTSNSELNYLTDNAPKVIYEPKNDLQPHTHLSWFNALWYDPEAIEWTGKFTEIIGDSPIGDLTYGPYDVYIKTLMEIFPDELIEPHPFTDDVEEYLHPFQNQNALSLRRKLPKNGVAMLSDSVGLGKTVTASAVIDQYIKEDKYNIMLILPASLKQHWIKELEDYPWNLIYQRDFRIITHQNLNEIEEAIYKSGDRKGTRDEIDLFVIDEAHNLRNQNSKRHQAVLELLQENPNSHVMLLTATPINNSLMDFSYQIQLALKGDLVSRKVRFKARNTDTYEYIDFFEALKRIQSEAARAEKQGKEYDWNHHKHTLISGLRHYLVRSTRQGVIKGNAMKEIEGKSNTFPESKVTQFTYKYDDNQKKWLKHIIDKNVYSIFEGINPNQLNIDVMTSITQSNSHPLDFVKDIDKNQKNQNNEYIESHYNLENKISNSSILFKDVQKISIILSIYKIINTLGFAPYKIGSYEHGIYGKSIEYLRLHGSKDDNNKSKLMQLSIHNMLHTTWLKRLESSVASLYESVNYYLKRISLFEKWLERGYLVNLTDVSTLESEYGDSIEKAFEDYDEYLNELSDALEVGEEVEVKKRGIERRYADSNIYNLKQLKLDLERDKKIANFLCYILDKFKGSHEDKKIKSFASNLENVLSENKFGKKVIVFSYFSDTINYLEKELPDLLDSKVSNFKKRSRFISGQDGNVKKIAQLFSPQSQKYDLKKEDREIDFLFTTDVLAEGQNLQDAAVLVNYDLHWNPVRMIQRNGRINRLGSNFEEILIANARPHEDLETYLKLVRRLESKIDGIKNTIGTDQSVLGEKENPIEFTDTLEESYGFYSIDDEEASKVLIELEDKDDVLDWVDDYSIELRNFLDDNSDTEIERVKSIPIGKWNFLPKDDSTYTILTDIIGLYKTDVIYTSTKEKIEDYAFVKIQKSAEKRGPFSNVIAKYMPEYEALERIKTIPEDNQRKVDSIDVNREEYINKGSTELTYNFNTYKTIYEIKPAAVRAITAIRNNFPDDNLIETIESSITRSNEKREFEILVRKINKEIKENNRLYISTVNRFRELYNNLKEKNNLNNELTKIEGVLFYADK